MKVLYICTHNRCRSILSEAITNKRANGKIIAKSAGSEPAGQVHPLTLKYLEQMDYSTKSLSSKSWEDLGDFQPDVVVTVCDSAAGEACPLWLSSTPKLHWGLTDPSKLAETQLVESDETNLQVEQAFKSVIETIELRVDQLLRIADLPIEEQILALERLIS